MELLKTDQCTLIIFVSCLALFSIINNINL